MGTANHLEPPPRVLSATTIIGDGVRNSSGDNLGRIEELVIDVDSGRVAYAVLSFGGFLGLGDKLFAVPWAALRIATDEHRFVVDVDRSVLEHAPGFDKRNWPDMSDPMFHRAIHDHYGHAYGAPAGAAQPRRADPPGPGPDAAAGCGQEHTMATKGIFEQLTRDHREVAHLMKGIEKARDEDTCMRLFAQVRTALLAHGQAEDEVLYVRLEEEADTEEMITHARDEQQQVEDLLEELGEIEDADEWMDRFEELKSSVEDHVKEQEGEIFPMARKLLDREVQLQLAITFEDIKRDELAGLAADEGGAGGIERIEELRR